MDNKKASGIWTDQTRNQICTQSLPNMRPSKGKKMLEGKSKITWIHYRRPEIQAQFDSDHKIWQWQVPGIQQHSQETMTHWPSPFLHGHLAYRQVDAEGTSPGLTRSICSFGSCLGDDLGPHLRHNMTALVSVPISCERAENQECSQDRGHRNPFSRWKSTHILVAVTIKIFQGAKWASVKIVLPPWRIQSEPWGKKESFSQETGLSLYCLLQWN